MYSIEQRDEQVRHTSASIRYHLYFDEAARHLVRVVMEIDAPGHECVAGFPVWTPGSYKVRDFSTNAGNVVVTDGSGSPLAWEWMGKNKIRVAAAGAESVRIEYLYYAFERTVRTSHVNRFHAFINPSNCLMYAEGREQEIHHVYFHHDRALWKSLATALSPVHEPAGDGQPVVYGALNYDILADSPVEIGNHFAVSFVQDGAQHDIAIAGYGNFDPNWIAERIKTIVATEARLFGGLPYDRYVFILQLYPNQRGGLEHARSSVNMWDSNLAADKEKTVQFLSLLCHEFFHTWNVKRIRPVELGPFNYNAENYTRMLWLAEGLTSYYDDLLTYRCGFYTRDEYLKLIATEHIGKLAEIPGRLAMSVKDSSYLAWTKLYAPTADSNNRFPSYYLKGGVVFLLLDLWIIAQTRGTKKLDDVLLALWALYEARPETGVTEQEFMEIVQETTGVDISAQFHEWTGLAGELPYNDVFAPLGLALEEKKADRNQTFGEKLPFMSLPDKVYTGLKLKDENGRTIVSQVDDGSPAAEAGIGVDDEVLAANGRRVTSSKDVDTEASLSGPGTAIALVMSCDGATYETSLRPARKTEWVLRIAGSDPDRKQLVDFWLAR